MLIVLDAYAWKFWCEKRIILKLSGFEKVKASEVAEKKPEIISRA